MTLAHPAPAPTHAPEVVHVPEPLTKVEARDVLADAARTKRDADLVDDLARSLAEAWERTEVWDAENEFHHHPDTAWAELARVAIERVKAATA